MTTINFDCLADKKTEEKWEPFTHLRLVDVLRKIRPKSDTHLSIVQNGISLLEKDLKANVPFILNLPIFAILYADLKMKLTPETPLEMVSISDLSSDAQHLLLSIDLLKIPPQGWKVDCKNKVLLIE